MHESPPARPALAGGFHCHRPSCDAGLPPAALEAVPHTRTEPVPLSMSRCPFSRRQRSRHPAEANTCRQTRHHCGRHARAAQLSSPGPAATNHQESHRSIPEPSHPVPATLRTLGGRPPRPPHNRSQPPPAARHAAPDANRAATRQMNWTASKRVSVAPLYPEAPPPARQQTCRTRTTPAQS